MEKEKRALIFAVIVFAVFVALVMIVAPALCKAEDETVKMYVTASHLNGRARPSKKSKIEALFDYGDVVDAWQWSPKHHWIEVSGGETGTVWVCWEYLTERLDESTWWNGSGKKVKIRKEPFGTVIGYLPRDGEVVVDRVIFGWGHCNKGWINLEYLTEEN